MQVFTQRAGAKRSLRGSPLRAAKSDPAPRSRFTPARLTRRERPSSKEAIAFSKSLKDFGSTKIIGISGGNTEKYVQWIEANNLQGLTLLNDKGDAVRNLFKVPKAAFGLLPGRVTYTLDAKGVCTSAYDNLLDAESHVSCALNAA